jgi:PAS domain-containing protein
MNEELLFSIGDVSSIVGLSRHTIRAWERRYGLLRPQRTPSGQRRYTADDVALLLQVKHCATRYGMSLKVATRSARSELSVPALETPRRTVTGILGREPVPDHKAPNSIWLSAANLLPQMIVILDINGFVSASNRAASHVFRIAPDQMVGRHVRDLLGEAASRPDLTAGLQRAYVLPFSFELDLRGTGQDGQWTFDCRPFSYEGLPQVAIFGRPTGPALTEEGQQSD